MNDDEIEMACDDLRMALQDLLANGPNEYDYKKAKAQLTALRSMAEQLNAELGA